MAPIFEGKPIHEGWWWLQFCDGPGPRYWDGSFWKQGSIFSGAEDYSEFPILGPCVPPSQKIDSMLDETANSLQNQRNLLASALGEVLVAYGVIRNDIELTGPELLLAAECAIESRTRQS